MNPPSESAGNEAFRPFGRRRSQRTPLGGVDAFHLVNDRVMLRRGLAGNHCVFAVTVAGHLDVRALIHRVHSANALLPELRRRLVQSPFGPAWVETNAPAPALRVRGVETNEAEAALFALVDERVSGDAPWGIDLLRGPTHETLVWRWFHPFTDAKGAERFVAWLGSGEGETPLTPPPAEERFDTGARPLAKLDRNARLAATRAYGNHMLRLAAVPIVSLASLSKGPLGKTRTQRLHLSADETRAFDKRVRERAKLAETAVMVLLSARLYDALLRSRGLAPAQHLVPVPLSLDPKVGATRMFGNNLTMMTFTLGRDDLLDTARAVATLGDQQRAIVKEKLDVGMLASLDFAKAVPPGVYHWFLTRPFGGEVSSLVISNPGAVTLNTFMGLPVVDAHALPTVATPPGFQVVFTRFAGRLSAFVGYAAGILTLGEERSLIDLLRTEMFSL